MRYHNFFAAIIAHPSAREKGNHEKLAGSRKFKMTKQVPRAVGDKFDSLVYDRAVNNSGATRRGTAMENRERQKKAYIHSSRLLRSVMIFLVCLLVIVVVFRGVFALYYHEFYSASRQEFQIPGLSEYFVPQGMTSCGDGNFLLSGYMSNTGFARIYYVNAVGRSRAMRIREADGTILTSHAGGIACGGTFTYVAGGGCCYVFETQSLLDPATDTAEVQETFESGNRASFCNIQGDCLLMGEYAYGTKFQTDGAHHIVTPAGDRNTALMLAFPLDDREPFGVRETPIAAYSIPERVQGMCYTDDGRMVLSASSAVGASQLYLYDYGAAVGGRRGIYWEKGRPISLYYLDSSSCTDIIHLPPYSEEVMFDEHKLYILFESASKRFQFGQLVGADYVYSMDLPDWKPDGALEL